MQINRLLEIVYILLKIRRIRNLSLIKEDMKAVLMVAMI